jgi:hypothetical protein
MFVGDENYSELTSAILFSADPDVNLTYMSLIIGVVILSLQR